MRTIHHGVSLGVVLLGGHVCNLAGKRCSPASPHKFIDGSSPCNAIRSPFRPTRLYFNTHKHFFTHTMTASNPNAIRVLGTTTGRGNTTMYRVLRGYIVFGSKARRSMCAGRNHSGGTVCLRRNGPVLFKMSGRCKLVRRNFKLGIMGVNRGNIARGSVLIRSTRYVSGALRLGLTLVRKPSFPITLKIVHSIRTPACSSTIGTRVRRITTGGGCRGFRGLLVAGSV